VSCTASKFDRDCGGCRHCADCPPTPGEPGILHLDPQAVADARVWRRHRLRERLIGDRANN